MVSYLGGGLVNKLDSYTNAWFISAIQGCVTVTVHLPKAAHASTENPFLASEYAQIGIHSTLERRSATGGLKCEWTSPNVNPTNQSHFITRLQRFTIRRLNINRFSASLDSHALILLVQVYEVECWYQRRIALILIHRQRQLSI